MVLLFSRLTLIISSTIHSRFRDSLHDCDISKKRYPWCGGSIGRKELGGAQQTLHSAAEIQSLTAGSRDRVWIMMTQTGMKACRASPFKNPWVSFSLTAERQTWVRLTHGFQQTHFKHTQPRPDMLLRNLLSTCQSMLNRSKRPCLSVASSWSPERPQHKECLITEKCTLSSSPGMPPWYVSHM